MDKVKISQLVQFLEAAKATYDDIEVVIAIEYEHVSPNVETVFIDSSKPPAKLIL